MYVELPFWLMTKPGTVDVAWRGQTFAVDIWSPWKEVHLGEVTDSKQSVVFYVPETHHMAARR